MRLGLLTLLAACSLNPPAKDSDAEDTSTDSEDTDTGDTDTSETGDTDTAETGDTDTAETGDTGDTGDTDTAPCDSGMSYGDWYVDADHDGYGAGSVLSGCGPAEGLSATADDCDDTRSDVSPAATETCDDRDDDCDGAVDEGLTSAYYADADDDGFGDADNLVYACSLPEGYTTDTADCDDSNAAISPLASEWCDGLDDDCDGVVDEGVTSTFYADADADGYGNATAPVDACGESDGMVADATDCDDTDATVSPGATETCNDVDDDCDGEADEASKSTFYADSDGDGYGDAGVTTSGCTAPGGFVADASDCDDSEATIHPGGTDTAEDGVDANCDGQDPLALPSGAHSDEEATVVLTSNGTYLDTFEMAPIFASGDLDGDGVGDLVTEAYRDDDFPTANEVIYLIPGPVDTGGNVAGLATLRLWATERLFIMEEGADSNRDGVPELLVRHTDPTNSSQGLDLVPGTTTGDVELLDLATIGGTALRWSGTTGTDGMSGTIGDFDGDGFDDLAMSDTTRSGGGRVAVITNSLPAGALDVMTEASWSTSGADSRFGWVYPSPIPGGDLDGDGYSDLAVDDWDTHTTYVCSGGATGTLDLATACPRSVAFSTGSPDASRSLVIDGDLDGDGNPDLVAGSVEDGTTRAFFSLPIGVTSSDAADVIIDTDGAYNAGQGANVTDVDRDGFAEILISSPYADDGGPNYGMVYLFSGLDGGGSFTTTDAAASWQGDTYNYFGYYATMSTDITDDASGYPDLVVAGPYTPGDYSWGIMVFPGE